MKSYYPLLVISVFLLFLISCTSNRIYWVDLTDNGLSEGKITVGFFDKHYSWKTKIIVGKDRYVKIPEKKGQITMGNYTSHHICINPSIDSIDKNMPLEIFVFDISIKQNSNTEFVINKKEGVDFYYVYSSIDDREVVTFSKDNIVNVGNVKERKDIDDLVSQLDKEDYSYYSGNKAPNKEKFSGGFIVKSRVTNTYIWLDSQYYI